MKEREKEREKFIESADMQKCRFVEQFFARIKATINSIEIAIIIKNELCETSEKLQEQNTLFSAFISDFIAVLC